MFQTVKKYLNAFFIVLVTALIIGAACYGLILYFSGGELTSSLCHKDCVKTIELTERLKIVGATLAGLAVILNALFINRRAEAHETQNDNELFSTATQHLGNSAESVRLGGIYSLYELALNEKYKKNVQEILCSHIRSKTTEKEYQETYKSSPSIEIESVLKLVTNEIDCKRFTGLRLHLKEAYLHGAVLNDAQLHDANLNNAQLQGANLNDAKLQDADLVGAKLQGADLNNAKLQGAVLNNAQLHGANLVCADLCKAHLYETQFQGADLLHANLQGAKLVGTNFQGVRSTQLDPRITILNFQKRIKARTGKDAELDDVVLSGGMSQDDSTFRDKYLANSNTGSYTEEEADEYINDYEEAMGVK